MIAMGREYLFVERRSPANCGHSAFDRPYCKVATELLRQLAAPSALGYTTTDLRPRGSYMTLKPPQVLQKSRNFTSHS